MSKFKVGEKVVLQENPFENLLPSGEKFILDIKETSDFDTTSSQWIKIDGYNDWIDSSWFKKQK